MLPLNAKQNLPQAACPTLGSKSGSGSVWSSALRHKPEFTKASQPPWHLATDLRRCDECRPIISLANGASTQISLPEMFAEDGYAQAAGSHGAQRVNGMVRDTRGSPPTVLVV